MPFVALESFQPLMQLKKVDGLVFLYCYCMQFFPFIPGCSCVTAWIVHRVLRHTLTLAKQLLVLLDVSSSR